MLRDIYIYICIKFEITVTARREEKHAREEGHYKSFVLLNGSFDSWIAYLSRRVVCARNAAIDWPWLSLSPPMRFPIPRSFWNRHKLLTLAIPSSLLSAIVLKQNTRRRVHTSSPFATICWSETRESNRQRGLYNLIHKGNVRKFVDSKYMRASVNQYF